MTKASLLLLALPALLAACGQTKPEAPAEPAAKEIAATASEAVAPAAPAADASVMPKDQTTPAQAAEQDAAAAKAGLPTTKQTRTSFKCDNDETVEVRFFPDQGIAVLVRGGQNVELNQEVTASGFKYSNGQTSISGKGNELTMQVGMMAAAKCTAI